MNRVWLLVTLCGVVAGTCAAVCAEEASPAPPTLYVVGDSTANNSADLGWASHLAPYFDASAVRVVNRARGGRSSRTFQAEGLWSAVVNKLQPGDIVLIQFGHNDGGSADGGKGRGSLRGLGEETLHVTRPDGGAELVHTFGWYLRKYIADTRAHGATPIVLSLTVRNIWRDGRVERGSGSYSQWSEEVAGGAQCAFVDASAIIADHYEELGEEKVAELFPKDHTHTSAAGAALNAELIVAGLKGLEENPLDSLLSAKGDAVPAIRPR